VLTVSTDQFLLQKNSSLSLIEIKEIAIQNNNEAFNGCKMTRVNIHLLKFFRKKLHKVVLIHFYIVSLQNLPCRFDSWLFLWEHAEVVSDLEMCWSARKANSSRSVCKSHKISIVSRNALILYINLFLSFLKWILSTIRISTHDVSIILFGILQLWNENVFYIITKGMYKAAPVVESTIAGPSSTP